MTKAELLHLLKRLRWLSLILPLASVAGFRAITFLITTRPAFSSVLNPYVASLQASLFAMAGWAALTWLCSVHIAYIAAEDHGLSSGPFG